MLQLKKTKQMKLMKQNSHPQKNTLLKAAKAHAATKAFKRVFFSPPQIKLKNKKSPTLQKNKTSFHRTVRTLTDIALNINGFRQTVSELQTVVHRTDRRASGNSGFKKLAVQWLQEVQFSNETFVVADSLVLRNRQLLKPAKRQAVKKLHFSL